MRPAHLGTHLGTHHGTHLGTALLVLLGLLATLACSPTASTTDIAELPTLDLEEQPAFPLSQHLESADLAAGKLSPAEIFEAGRLIFHTEYNGLDGVGVAILGNGASLPRFSNVPPGGNLLAVNSQSCGGCHVDSASGPAHTHVTFDNDQDGVGPFNVRSTTSTRGDGILQNLAIEITEDLFAARDDLASQATSAPGESVSIELQSKGVTFGVLAAVADADGNVTFDTSRVKGVSEDLVVRPMGWKGGIPTVRLNSAAPAMVGMGMQPEEFVWRLPGGDENPDLDGDGVSREFSVGDITALTIYTAGLETPAEFGRLADMGLVQPPTAAQVAMIDHGRTTFDSIGCTSCHIPEMTLTNTVFEEPTARGGGHYFDKFLASRDPSYDPENPVRFDLLVDAMSPRLEAVEGGAVVRLYGDLKRHAMGRHLADHGGPTAVLAAELAPAVHDGNIILLAPDVFLTPELWGVANTGPWLHDGRAGSLDEAVLLHGEDDPVAAGEPGRSEAQEARDAYAALISEDRAAVIAFLRSLVTFTPEDT